jgi:putative membrane protein
MLVFVVAAYVLSNFWENLSISTGFPFGHYHYTGHPQLIHVPLVIGPAYVALGYISWLTASVLLDRADERLDWRTRAGRLNTFALPAIGAAVMTMFDVGSDSNVSTMNHVWVWDRGGGVFGVPFTNYLGWWFVVYTFLQVFALVAARVQTRAPRQIGAVTPGSLLQPVLAYLAVGLPSVIRFIAGSDVNSATDARGTTWAVHDLNETMLTITVFGLITVAVLALIKIASQDLAHQEISDRSSS